MKIALLLAFSFLMGSIPFGVILARVKGVDLRKTGSGNIGATNVLRSVGKGAAVFTLLGDLLKGTAAVALGKALGVGPLFEGLMGLTAILGHDFSIFQGLRGGKGVATSLGVVLLYAPWAGLITVGLWLATVALTRYSSLGAVVSFGLLPVSMIVTGNTEEAIGLSVIIFAVLLIKHRENIGRLMKGTERRVGEKA
ncbi:MAG: glycerol-3-phosphate 1-O-acyltransferase PlsY [Nitrospirota bacterium]|jgi:glycerol-3-phosphate acyltransferase PlsY